MLPYWILFLYFAIGALASQGRLSAAGMRAAAVRTGPANAAPVSVQPAPGQFRSEDKYPLLAFGFIFITLMAGFRYRVGGDWGSYALMFRQTGRVPYADALKIADPGYQTVAWIVAQIGAGVWLVNLICAAIFCWGLQRLVRHQPQPWLATLAAIPYLVIVVAMGYTRQAVAIGIMMAGIASLLDGRSAVRFLFYGIAATTFHKTAFLIIPLVLFGSAQARLFVIVLAAMVATFLFQYFLAGDLPRLTRDYLDAGYQSRGAGIRVGMTVVCGALLLLFKRRLNFAGPDYLLWRNFAFAAFALLGSLFFVNSSTVIDRVGLYLFPLQVVVLGRIPLLFNSDAFGKAAVLAFSFLVLFIWANFGDNSFYWNPYRLVPISGLGWS